MSITIRPLSHDLIKEPPTVINRTIVDIDKTLNLVVDEQSNSSSGRRNKDNRKKKLSQ